LNAASAGFHSGPQISNDTMDIEEEQNADEPDRNAGDLHAHLVSNVKKF